MDHLDKEVIESLSEPAKRMFKSLDYRSKQRMLKKAREMAKAEKIGGGSEWIILTKRSLNH